MSVDETDERLRARVDALAQRASRERAMRWKSGVAIPSMCLPPTSPLAAATKRQYASGREIATKRVRPGATRSALHPAGRFIVYYEAEHDEGNSSNVSPKGLAWAVEIRSGAGDAGGGDQRIPRL